MNNFKFFQYCTYTNTPVSKRQGYWLFRHKSSNKNAYRDNVLPVQSCPSATGNTLGTIKINSVNSMKIVRNIFGVSHICSRAGN